MLSHDAFLPGCGLLKDYWQSKISREIKSKSHHAIFWNLLDNSWPNLGASVINETLLNIKFYERINNDSLIFKIIKLVRKNKPKNYQDSLKLLENLGAKLHSDHYVL